MGNAGRERVAVTCNYQNYYSAYFTMVREVCAQ
jgi:hypothetical protein